jgi:hypothetical protein
MLAAERTGLGRASETGKNTRGILGGGCLSEESRCGRPMVGVATDEEDADWLLWRSIMDGSELSWGRCFRCSAPKLVQPTGGCGAWERCLGLGGACHDATRSDSHGAHVRRSSRARCHGLGITLASRPWKRSGG